jgi:hypothetical protein
VSRRAEEKSAKRAYLESLNSLNFCNGLFNEAEQQGSQTAFCFEVDQIDGSMIAHYSDWISY